MFIKEIAKKIRISQPFNRLATTSLKALFHDGRTTPEIILKYLPKVGQVNSRLPNGKTLKLWSFGDELYTNHTYWYGWNALEPETKTLFFEMARNSRVTLDIGAHVGTYALAAAWANPRGRVFAFEPLPVVFDRLSRNVALNQLSNLTCVRAAAGSHDHAADFYHVPNKTMDTTGVPSSSSLSWDFASQPGVPIEATRVDVISLDRYLTENSIPAVDLIKMDTEETEPDVLRGMLITLATSKPKIICEVLKEKNSELEDILGPLKYDYYLLTPDGPRKRKRIRAATARDNYLFLPRLGH
jgi:FkbM family methyltransferase